MKNKLLLLVALCLIPSSVNAARLWSSGCEFQGDTGGPATANLEFHEGTPYIDPALKRTGLSSCYFQGTNRSGSQQVFSAATAADVYFRGYLYIDAMPTTTDATLFISFWDEGLDSQEGGVALYTDGKLYWVDDDYTQSATSSSALTTGVWYRIEVNYDAVDGAEVLVDGVTYVTVGAHDGDSVDKVQFGLFNNSGPVPTGRAHFDDTAFNDTSGTAQTGYPGAGRIVFMQPNGAGDANGCSAGDSTSVDEVTPDDDTTFCNLDADTGGDILDVAMEPSFDAGIDPYDTITLVQVGGRDRQVSATPASLEHRIKSASGGTTSSGTSYTHNDTTYFTNGDAFPRNYKLTSYTDPTTAGAWTPTGTNSLDSMQIGINCTDCDPDTRVTTLWALVDFVDGVAPKGQNIIIFE